MSFLTKEFLTSPEGQEQLKALDDSIKSWEDKIIGIYKDCPLCEINTTHDDNADCTKCIIMIDTGKGSCDNTPFYETDEGCPEECKFMLDWLVNLKQRANDCINS